MMRVTILGCRGSTPTPGAEFVRYGGDTSCVAVTLDGEPAPSLLLDAGTGLRHVADLLDGAAFRGTVLLGHLHWDHTHGLPFAPAVDRDDAHVDLYLPAQDVEPEELLARAMGPPHFPITPAGLRGRWTFSALDEGATRLGDDESPHESGTRLGDVAVLAREIPHTPGRTFGYRIAAGGASIAYLSDHHPGRLGRGRRGFGPLHEAACTLADGVDLLIHDAQYTAAEYAANASYGHAAIDYAVELADAAGVGRLLLFHHDPARTDAELDAIAATLPAQVAVAHHRMHVDLPIRRRGGPGC